MYRFVAALLAGLLAFWAFAVSAQRSPKIAIAGEKLRLDRPWKGEVAGNRLREWQTKQLHENQLYSLTVSLESGPLKNNERYLISLIGNEFEINKTLHAGNPFQPGSTHLNCRRVAAVLSYFLQILTLCQDVSSLFSSNPH